MIKRIEPSCVAASSLIFYLTFAIDKDKYLAKSRLSWIKLIVKNWKILYSAITNDKDAKGLIVS